MRVVLALEAVDALIQPGHTGWKKARQALQAACRLRRDWPCPPSRWRSCIGAVYRRWARPDAGRNARRGSRKGSAPEHDRALAGPVGAIPAAAGTGSGFLAGAHAAAVAVEDGGVVLTGDVDDLSCLAAPYRTVVIQPFSP